MDITYDRNSNITRVEDNVHVGFDWSYTMDNLDRLSRGERGTWSGSITSQKEDQTWALDQVGNWDQVSLDFNADNSYGGTGEYNDDRTHNTVNELTARDTDDNGSDNYTLTYDAVGNLTDDAESYEYVYDPFGRLRKVNTQASALLAEYKYNGLGYMIAIHEDTDTDADVDSNDKWFYPAYDERWRMVAIFRESDTAPKEEWVVQDAGLDGRGRSSYINGVVLRNKDANTAWTSASDGVLEERIYLCQNWRGDVSALVYANGDQVEQVRYSPYGTPFGLPGGDTDSDGDCDATDVTQIQTWINAPAYDVRGDIELDGDVDSTDKSVVQASYQGLTLGRGKLSSFGNRTAWAGHIQASAQNHYLARKRFYTTALGWLMREQSQASRRNAYTYDYSLVTVRPMGFGGQNPSLSTPVTLNRTFAKWAEGPCFERNIDWKFKLTVTASDYCGKGEGGWVVQHVKFTDSFTCGDAGFQYEMHEGFYVAPLSYAAMDYWKLPKSFSNGTRTIEASATFFCESVTGDLGAVWPPETKSSHSGTAPSTTGDPGIWWWYWYLVGGVPESGATDPQLKSPWVFSDNCCPTAGPGGAPSGPEQPTKRPTTLVGACESGWSWIHIPEVSWAIVPTCTKTVSGPCDSHDTAKSCKITTHGCGCWK